MLCTLYFYKKRRQHTLVAFIDDPERTSEDGIDEGQRNCENETRSSNSNENTHTTEAIIENQPNPQGDIFLDDPLQGIKTKLF